MKMQFSERETVIAAFGSIYIIWGSTYLANYLAIQSIPPFLMAGSRFGAAGALLYGLAVMLGAPVPTPRQWRHAFKSGFFLLALGTGGVVWAEQFVDTGITALLIAFQPLLVVLLMWALQGKRPGTRVLFGIALGIAGMAALVGQQSFVTDPVMLTGVLVILGSMSSWGYASVVLHRMDLPRFPFQATAMQMIGGSLWLFLMAFLTGEHRHFDPALITAKAIWAWLYLVLFGSILAFSAFNYLLRRVSPDKVATSNYINPIVALFLGWAFNSEVITLQSVLAAALMLAGVFFINSRLRNTRAPLSHRIKKAGSFRKNGKLATP